MDPETALKAINDTDNVPRAYRAECLEALAEWLGKGGFMPPGTLTEAVCESLRSEGKVVYELAISLRQTLEQRS